MSGGSPLFQGFNWRTGSDPYAPFRSVAFDPLPPMRFTSRFNIPSSQPNLDAVNQQVLDAQRISDLGAIQQVEAQAQEQAVQEVQSEESWFEFILNSAAKPIDAVKNAVEAVGNLIATPIAMGIMASSENSTLAGGTGTAAEIGLGNAGRAAIRSVGSAIPFSETAMGTLLPKEWEQPVADWLGSGVGTQLGGNQFFGSTLRPRDIGAGWGAIAGEELTNRDPGGSIFSEFGDSVLQDAGTLLGLVGEIAGDPLNFLLPGSGAARQGMNKGGVLVGNLNRAAGVRVAREMPEVGNALKAAGFAEEMAANPTAVRTAFASMGRPADQIDTLAGDVAQAVKGAELDIMARPPQQQARLFGELLGTDNLVAEAAVDALEASRKTGATSLIPGTTFGEQALLGQRDASGGSLLSLANRPTVVLGGKLAKKLSPELATRTNDQAFFAGLTKLNESLGASSNVFKPVYNTLARMRAGELSQEEAAKALAGLGPLQDTLAAESAKGTFTNQFGRWWERAKDAIRGGFIQDADTAATQALSLVTPTFREQIGAVFDKDLAPILKAVDESVAKAKANGAYDDKMFMARVRRAVEDAPNKGGEIKDSVMDDFTDLVEGTARSVRQAEQMLLFLQNSNRAVLRQLDDSMDYFGRVFSPEMQELLARNPKLRDRVRAWKGQKSPDSATFAREARDKFFEESEQGLRNLLGIENPDFKVFIGDVGDSLRAQSERAQQRILRSRLLDELVQLGKLPGSDPSLSDGVAAALRGEIDSAVSRGKQLAPAIKGTPNKRVVISREVAESLERAGVSESDAVATIERYNQLTPEARLFVQRELRRRQPKTAAVSGAVDDGWGELSDTLDSLADEVADEFPVDKAVGAGGKPKAADPVKGAAVATAKLDALAKSLEKRGLIDAAQSTADLVRRIKADPKVLGEVIAGQMPLEPAIKNKIFNAMGRQRPRSKVSERLVVDEARDLVVRIRALPGNIRGHLEAMANEVGGLTPTEFDIAFNALMDGKKAGGIVTVDQQSAREVNGILKSLGLTPSQARDAVKKIDQLTPETRAVLRSRISRVEGQAGEEAMAQAASINAMYDGLDYVISKLPKRVRDEIESVLPPKRDNVVGIDDARLNAELGEKFKALAKKLSGKDGRFATAGVPDPMLVNAVETLNRMADDITAFNAWKAGKRAELEERAVKEWRRVFGDDDAAIDAAQIDMDLFNAGGKSGDTRQVIRRANVQYEVKAGEKPRRAGTTIEPATSPVKSAGKPTDAAEQAARQAGYRSLGQALQEAGFDNTRQAVRDTVRYLNLGDDAVEALDASRIRPEVSPVQRATDMRDAAEAKLAKFDEANKGVLSRELEAARSELVLGMNAAEKRLENALSDAANAQSKLAGETETLRSAREYARRDRTHRERILAMDAKRDVRARRDLSAAGYKSVDDAVKDAEKVKAIGPNAVTAIQPAKVKDAVETAPLTGTGDSVFKEAVEQTKALTKQREEAYGLLSQGREKVAKGVKEAAPTTARDLVAAQRKLDEIDGQLADMVEKLMPYGTDADDVLRRVPNEAKAAWVKRRVEATGFKPRPGMTTGLDLIRDLGSDALLPSDLGALTRLAMTEVPEDVARSFRRLSQITTGEAQAFKFVRDAADTVNSVWRGFILSTPVSIINDLVGNALTAVTLGNLSFGEIKDGMRAYLSVAQTDGRLARLMKKNITEYKPKTIKTAYGAMSEVDAIRELEKRGMFDIRNAVTMRDPVSELAGALPITKEGRLARGVRKATKGAKAVGKEGFALREMNDNGFRAAMALKEIQKGKSWEDAIRAARNVFFDYSDVTRMEKEWLRRVTLFYTWTRKAIPTVLRSIVENPVRFKMMMLVSGAGQNTNDPDMPEWARRLPGMYLGENEDGVPQMLALPGAMMNSATEMLEGDVVENLVRQSNPLIRAGIERAFDRDLFTGDTLGFKKENERDALIEGKGADRAPSWMNLLPQSLKDSLGFHAVTDKGVVVKYAMDPKLRWWLENALPLGAAMRTADLAAAPFGADERKTVGEQLLPLAGARVRAIPSAAPDAATKRKLAQLRDKIGVEIAGLPDRPIFVSANYTWRPNRNSKTGEELAKMLDSIEEPARRLVSQELDRRGLRGEARSVERDRLLAEMRLNIVDNRWPGIAAKLRLLDQADMAHARMTEPEKWENRYRVKLRNAAKDFGTEEQQELILGASGIRGG